MPRRPFLVPLLIVCALIVRSASASPPRTLPDGRVWLQETLENGLEVSIVQDPHLELVATQVWYHTGSADEDNGSRGMAHLFEHLMFGPTRDYGKDQVFHLHHRAGGSNNAFTGFDETVYVSEVAPPYHLEVLKVEAARMEGLVLTREELENEQKIVTEELRLRTENDPFSRVMVRALKSVLGDHPYGLTPAGTKEDIAAATLESCEAFYEKHYYPGNAHLVVVGPVDPAETLKAVKEAFGGLEARDYPSTRIPPILGWDVPSEVVLKEDLPPVETAIRFYLLPPADHPDSDALAMLRSMLEGQANPFREDLVRKREKALEAGLEIFSGRRGGALGFYAAQLPYRRKKTAYRQIGISLKAVGDSLTEERLETARRQVLSREYRELNSASGQADRIGRARWYRGDAGEAFRQLERMKAVTLEDVQRVWNAYIRDGKPVDLYIRPEKVPFLVRAFGWLYPVVR